MSKIIGLAIFLLFSSFGMVSAEQPDKTVKELFDIDDVEQEEQKKELETVVDNEIVSSSAADFSFWDVVRMIVAFLFVGALLYLLLRFINKKNQSYQKGHIISNLGGANVGNNKSVQIVKIGSKVYIVGVGENVQLLSEITDQEEIEKLLEDHNEAVENMLKPSDILTKIKAMRKQNNKEASFVEQFKKQLDDMSTNRKQLSKELQKKEDAEDE